MPAILSFFRRPLPALAGLDISKREIRLVELGRLDRPGSADQQHLRLERYACEALPAGAVSRHQIEDLDGVSATVQSLWQKSACRSHRVAMSIPALTAMTALLPLGAATRLDDDAQLAALAQQHASSLLPYPVAQACIDFHVQPARSENASPHLLIAAAPRQVVAERLAIAEAAGLEVIVVEIDSYAQYAAWRRTVKTAATQLTGLLQIDASGLQLSLFAGTRLLCREQAYAHPQHTTACTASSLWQTSLNTLNLTAASAETANAATSHHIVLTGQTVVTPEFLAALSRQTQASVSIATPFAGLLPPPGIDAAQLPPHDPAYLTACGLALRRFDS